MAKSRAMKPAKIQFPAVPDAALVKERLEEVLEQAAKLKILLRTASELEELAAQKSREASCE